MMTMEEKLANIETNRNRLAGMLAGTTYDLIHYSLGTPILTTSPNPHAYVVLDRSDNSVIPGLMVFFSFGLDDIAWLDKPRTIENPNEREKLLVKPDTDKDDVIRFIRTRKDACKDIKELISDFIVNRLGINLCSVKSINVDRQEDGQIKDIKIEFIPSAE